MKKTIGALARRWLSLILALAMTLSLAVAGAWAEDTEVPLPNGDFSSGTAENWTLSGFNEVKIDTFASNNNTPALNLWLSDTEDTEGSASYTVSLEAGSYYFTFDLSGAASSSNLRYAITSGEDTLVSSSEPYTTTGWDVWTTEATQSFTLTANGEVTFSLSGTVPTGYWGYLDNLKLFQTASGSQEPEEGYKLSVSVSNPEPQVGDTVSLTAEVTCDGQEITDLAGAGLHLWWWTDTWAEGHEDGLSDAAYSNYDDNSGLSLTADVTLPSEGTYYIAAELQDSSNVRQAITYIPLQAEKNTYITGDLDVEKISGLDSDFIMGLDISSVVSEFASGVTFKDYEGNTLSNVTEFCQFLKSCGITHIRVRVWNNPFDADGNGYGGGNNDIDAAVEIAKGCAAAGLKLLVDFHYSDFWADPGKQQTPKAWAGYSLAQKAEAIGSFTTQSLQEIAKTGADIDMVQVGNETTNSFVEEKGDSYADMCALFQAGSQAIRAFDKDIRVVIHFTNPERSNQLTNWAQRLQDNGVDYDILATSYYPYWHGTLDNLKSQFQAVQATYGKDVMVAETSYAYTLDDTDGHDNTVRKGTNDTSTSYPFTPQGQADCIRDIIAAVSEAGGLGVYYWEPAWITVGDTTGLSGDAYDARVSANKELWEQFGSGWASSYAAEYDPKDAGKWYGGSAVDNQAFFYPDGTPVASLHVWDYVKTGAISNRVSVDSVESFREAIELNGSYSLPTEVKVTYNNGTVSEPVTWDAQEAAAINSAQAGVYVVHGSVSLSRAVTDGEYAGQSTAETTYTLIVREPNLITDANDAGLESGDNFTVQGSGIKNIPSKEDVLEGAGGLHWYSASAVNSSVTYNIPLTLEPGWYTFEAVAMGFAGDTVTLSILDTDGNPLFTGSAATLAGWTNVLSECLTPSVTFQLQESASVLLRINLGISDGGWGSLDCLNLHRHERLTCKDNQDGTHSFACADCGAALETETCTLLPVSAFDAAEGKDAHILYRCACGAEKTVPLTAQIQGLPDSISLYLGRSVNLVASFTTGELPEGVSCQSVYASSNTKVLRVSDQGRLTPIRMGACDITYSVLATVTLADSSQTVVVAQQTVPATVSIKLFDLPECGPGHLFPIWWPVIKFPYPQFQIM